MAECQSVSQWSMSESASEYRLLIEKEHYLFEVEFIFKTSLFLNLIDLYKLKIFYREKGYCIFIR